MASIVAVIKTQARHPAQDINLLLHQARAIKEEEQLHIRLIALLEWVEHPSFAELDGAEQYRMKLQAMAMAQYQLVLAERISHFKG